MSSTDVTKVLPNTEAMRDAIELLNALDDSLFATIAEKVLEGICNNNDVSTTTASSAAAGTDKQTAVAQEAAIRFIIYQLTYFSINKKAAAVEALTEAVTSSSSVEPSTLSAEKADVLSDLWVANGKDIVQLARNKIIRKVCAGSNAASAGIAFGSSSAANNTLSSSTHREPHIHCSTSIRMAEGNVVEVLPDSADGIVKVNRAAQSMDFSPLALLTLPNGATVEMSEEQAYDLFSELDAIQRQMDSLFASA